MMNKEINIEDLRPIAVVDYNTIDDIKEFINLLLSLGGGSKTFDDYFEASLVHNGMAVAYYDDEDDYDDEDYDDEDYDDEEESEYSSHELGIDAAPYKKAGAWLDEDEKVDWCIDFAYENQDDTPIFPHIYITKKSEDVPEKLMEYMKKLVNTGINELCIGDKMFVDSDSSSSDDDSPCWY